MGKKYITPEMEIAEFDTEDVITTSDGIPTDSANPGQDGGSGYGKWN